MIIWASIWAVVLRHTRMWKRDPNFLLGGFYWPVLDILIWGFLGSWIAQSQTSEFANYESVALMGILLWQVVGRGCNFMVIAFSEELWSHNLVNLFSLPLRLIEWMIGVALFYAIMIALTSLVCIGIIYLLYDVSLWYICSTFLIFFPPLYLSGIWLGFTCLQVIVLLGRRGVELAFVIAWFILPFCGAYYPVEVLPRWAQMISTFLPMSYLFQGMRRYMMYQEAPTRYVLIGYGLSFLYATVAIIGFIFCFNHTKKRGLSRLAE